MDNEILKQWVDAVTRGEVADVRRLFANHPELRGRVNEPLFPFDSSAVFHSRDHLEMVDLLLENGADLNQKTRWWAGGFGVLEGTTREVAEPLIARGATVDIWAAVSLHRIDRVKELLDENPDLIAAPGGDGKQPLHYATSVEMVDLLVDRGADVNARDVDHESTPAQYLVKNEPVVRRLLDRGAEADIFMAAALGDIAIARACVQQDADCTSSRLGSGKWHNEAGGHIYNWTLGHDLTPLDVAHDRGGHDTVFDFLRRHSSDDTLLRYFIWSGDVDEARRLAGASPRVVIRLRESDPGMMARAAWWYRPVAVELLLEFGFDRHAVGVHHSTPLDRAAFHGYADIVATLLDGDPTPPLEFRNEFGGTPLDACLYGAFHGWKTGHPQNHERVVRLLVAAGSVVDPSWLPTGRADLDAALRDGERSA